MTHAAPLTDVIVHGQDIARPLGRALDPPTDSVVVALDLVTSPKGQQLAGISLEGLAFEATDVGWSAGDGDTVRGTALDLLMGATGRASALTALRGPGTAMLAGRLP